MSDDGVLGSAPPSGFVVRVVTLGVGCRRAYVRAEWRDTLVVVEGAELELEHVDGSRYRFQRGDILTLDRLPVRALHNRGEGVLVLVVVSRRGWI